MTDQRVTLAQLFSPEKRLSADQLPSMESAKSLSALKEKLAKEAKINWPIAVEAIAGKLAEALDIGLPDIMLAAWRKYEILLEYTDEEKHPQSETSLVPLAEHTIKSQHKPYIDVLIRDEPVARIDFEVEVALTLEGVILKVQNGRIVEMFTGSCKGGGSIKYGDEVLLERETSTVPLPGEIRLGEGVPIPKFDRRAAQ